MAIGVIDGDDSQITELTAALLRVSPAQCVPLTKEQAIALGAAVSDGLEYGSEAGDPAWLDRSACERFMNWFKGWESAA